MNTENSLLSRSKLIIRRFPWICSREKNRDSFENDSSAGVLFCRILEVSLGDKLIRVRVRVRVSSVK